MLLIVTNRADEACDYLILRLREKGLAYQRLNTERYGRDYYINISTSNTGSELTIAWQDGPSISSSDITGVYFRQPRSPKFNQNINPADVRFAEREADETLRSAWRVLDEDLWLNHPEKLWIATNKTKQLRYANKVGLSIPPTLISQDPESIRLFADAHNRDVIVKAVMHGFLQEESGVRVATTQRLPADLNRYFQDFASVPAVYQPRIEKEYDVRAIVVGNEVFSTAIYSQEYPETELDWRCWDMEEVDLRHERHQLPPSVAGSCIDLTTGFGLNYSAIDLVRQNDGDYKFLELNPNGQWAWIEQQVGYPIRDAIIANLKD